MGKRRGEAKKAGKAERRSVVSNAIKGRARRVPPEHAFEDDVRFETVWEVRVHISISPRPLPRGHREEAKARAADDDPVEAHVDQVQERVHVKLDAGNVPH